MNGATALLVGVVAVVRVVYSRLDRDYWYEKAALWQGNSCTVQDYWYEIGAP